MNLYFANCPKGLEQLLQQEVIAQGATFEQETVGGIWFRCDTKTVYSICLWSRIANKVFLCVTDQRVATADDIYELVKAIDWREYLPADGSLWVNFQGTNRAIRNSQFGAMKIKDAIVDQFRQHSGLRPNVDKIKPQLIVYAKLTKGRVQIMLDLCGESLHRRGYRTQQGSAPLKENLAAAILYRCNWQDLGQQGCALLDPMCGSGTLLIEGGLMAANIAPGINRRQYAFERWLGFDRSVWADIKQSAQAAINLDQCGEIRGYDINPGVLAAAEGNIARAGLVSVVRVSQKSVELFALPTHTDLKPGLIITNPPYGERIGDLEQLGPLYRSLGSRLKDQFTGWQAGVFTGNPEAGKFMGLRAHHKYKLFNGTIASELLQFDVGPDYFVDAPPPETILTKPRDPYKVTEGALMVINRLKKNQKQLGKWINRSQQQCYRLYDADIPEYSAAIDVYGDYIHVQEYQAPKSIPEEKAQARLNDIIAAVKQFFNVDLQNISIKQRRRNRGKEQYQRAQVQQNRTIVVNEGAAQFEVNLWDYLDTGLFLDHRPVRRYIGEQAKGKKFLNLFCYTATASVQAILGGARESVSVDMSNTYLRWARRNFDLNSISSKKHRLEQSDSFDWLQQCREGFDLILLDPPSFSNSKRMDSVLDIQRDHVKLIKRCMELLNPNGLLIFSNNLRSFSLERDQLAKYSIENYHQQSLDPDFQRNTKIHQCWLIRHLSH